MRPQASPDLHGNAPDRCDVALLLVDVINDLEFDSGKALLKPALAAAKQLAGLRERARRAGVPCIYVNDNFGRWRSDFNMQVRHCLEGDVRGTELVKLLKPAEDDYFVLKPKHSAFYQTCLSLLLEHLGVGTLIIGGVTTDSCVTFTANDAYLHGFGVVVLSDGTASAVARNHTGALAQMERTLHARTPRCAQVSFTRRSQGTGVRIRKR